MSALLAPLRPYQGRVVLVGVSGGADSVALLRALLEAGARPAVAHLDHALRPESAGDAAWVRALCTVLDVPCEAVRVDVARVAAKRGEGLEAAGRRVRYDLFGRVARAHGAGRILTAHTRRDQAETVLWQLLRGEAVLHGIPPRRGRVERPWLDVGRDDVEAYLRALGQDWCEDATNADTAQTRSWLRHDILPLLETRFPGLEGSLARLARFQAQDDAALGELADRLTTHAPLERVSPAVLRRWVRQQLAAAGLDAHAGHIEVMAEALGAGQTAHQTLPGGVEVTATGGRLHTVRPGFSSLPDDIPHGWTVRSRTSGDRITLPGGTRKLSDVLTDLHVPRAWRDAVPLLVDAAGAVQWVGTVPPVWAVGSREAVGAALDPLDVAMGVALSEARSAADAAEVPVGAVVLGPDGGLLSRGRNRSRECGDMTRHAELEALRGASAALGTPYLTGCILVVTLEPCPMCLGAALEARVGHIVYGAANPKAGALGGVVDLLSHHWGHIPRITPGVRAREAARLLRETFAALRGDSQ